MTYRKLALQTLVLLLLLFSFTIDGFSQSQQAYRYLKDFSYLTKDRRTEDEKAEDFIQALKRGDRKIYRTVDYDVLLNVVNRLKRVADQTMKKQSALDVGFIKSFMWQMGGETEGNRKTLVNATLPGIFNLDPRVRLVATSWLRVLRPDMSMMRPVKMAVGVDVRVIRYDHASDDFVFTHPKIYETVASWEEYYREKDIDYPSVFAPGTIESNIDNSANPGWDKRIGGTGTNNNLTNPMNRDAKGAGDPDLVVTGLDARRWGAPNKYDQNRKWEVKLPYLGTAGAERTVEPVSMQDYLERVNAALYMAYYGLKDGMKLPDGRTFDPALYGCTGGVSCKDYEADKLHYVSRSITARFPGTTIVLKPIAGRAADSTLSGMDDLETNIVNRDVYRYYPDMTENGSTLSSLPNVVREKMQLLLGQNWQMGRRVPLGQGRMYVYVNAFGELVAGNPWVELTKLDMFITRHVWYQKIKSGHKNALAVISKDTFATMFLSIDGESPDVIPFLSCAGPKPMFDYKDVPVLLEGLRKNKVVSNRYVIMRALKDVYEQKPPYAELCPPELQRQINIALWEVKRENSRQDIDTGKIFHREAITVGKAPARPNYVPPQAVGAGKGDAYASDLDPVGPVGKDAVSRVDRVLDLGWTRPNDEVLANTHRIIVSNAEFSDPNLSKNKLDDQAVYDLDTIFKQRFFNLVAPNGEVKNYYQHRTEYDHLWHDSNMPVMVTDAPPGYSGTSWAMQGGTVADKAVNAGSRSLEPADSSKLDAYASGTAVSKDLSMWEAARYLDSLIVYDIERMSRAQDLINSILSGNRQAFMEAEWKDVESMILLCLKRLETAHRFPQNSAQSAVSASEKPENVEAANGPKQYAEKPVFDFFDMLEKVQVIKSYSDFEPALFKVDATTKNKVQIRRKREFVPIINQIKNLQGNTYNEDKRDNIVRAALGGIFNKDPRVRLTAIHFLRRLGPDESMLPDVEKARNINATPIVAVGENKNIESAETDDYRNAFIDTYTYRRFGNSTSNINAIADFFTVDRHKYEGALDRDVEERARGVEWYMSYVATLPPTAKYKQQIPHPAYDPRKNEFHRVINLPTAGGGSNQLKAVRLYGAYQYKAPSEELEKLYKFIHRKRLVRGIQRGDVNLMKKLSRSEFTILAENVDAEWAGYIPFQSFHSSLKDVSQDQWTKKNGWGERVPSDLAIFTGKDVRVIKEGINNSNFLVQKGTAEYLVRFYDFYDRCTDFKNRAMIKGCTDGRGYEPNGSFKKEIRDAMYYYIQDDIVVQEFELAFNGENPDGRAVIRAGSDLSYHLNPGGERVYLSLPVRIRQDIRDAVWGDYERLPEELKNILGIISTKAPRPNVLTYYNVILGLEPRIPVGDAGDQIRDF